MMKFVSGGLGLGGDSTGVLPAVVGASHSRRRKERSAQAGCPRDSRWDARATASLARCLKTMIQAALLIALGSLILGCKVKSSAAPTSLFPESGEVAGWARSGAVRTYDEKNLWQYIDGDAERYIQAGVSQVLTSDYRYQDKFDAVADVYQMSAPAGAQKIFSSESATGSQPIQLGDEGRVYQGSLVFRKGSCLVRLTAYEELTEASKGLVVLARGIEIQLSKVPTCVPGSLERVTPSRQE